jgi:hypothetical protein
MFSMLSNALIDHESTWVQPPIEKRVVKQHEATHTTNRQKQTKGPGAGILNTQKITRACA